MYEIKSILEFVHSGVVKGHPRFTVASHEHILDTETGVEFHLHDDYSKLTKGDEVLATSFDMTDAEKSILWGIKEAITPHDVMHQMKQQYFDSKYAKRRAVSHAYENPEPVQSLQPESDTKPYLG